jgi:hypothetical protein
MCRSRQVLEGYVFLGQVHGLGAEVSTAFSAAIVRLHAFGHLHCTLNAIRPSAADGWSHTETFSVVR